MISVFVGGACVGAVCAVVADQAGRRGVIATFLVVIVAWGVVMVDAPNETATGFALGVTMGAGLLAVVLMLVSVMRGRRHAGRTVDRRDASA